MNFLLYFLVFLAVAISVTNLVFMMKMAKKIFFLEKQSNADLDFENETTTQLARFQKITSTKLRALDNKIEIVDNLLKDMDEAYAKTLSIMTDLEKKLEAHKPVYITPKPKMQKTQEEETESILEIIENNETKNPLEEDKKMYETIKLEEEVIEIDKELDLKKHLTESLTESEKTKEEPVIQKETAKSPLEEKKEKVIELYKQGITPQEIAKKMNIGVGEVMLYINFYNS